MLLTLVAGTGVAVHSPVAAAATVLPAGTVVLWSGAAQEVPAGWAMCDGTDGTPDLRDRFVVGASADFAVGETGGAATTTLTEAELPAHSHGSGTLAAASAGGHGHGSGTLASGSAGGHGHGSGTLAAGSAGSHTHSIRGSVAGGFDQNRIRAGDDTNGRYTSSGAVLPAGDHTHPISGSTATAGAHTHPITGSTGSGAAHTHLVTGSTATTGGGAAIDNRPPFYALAYICRLPDGPTLAEGMVVLWSGAAGDLPEGWTLCDGTDGTPDLRDRFVVGAGADYEVGQTGGAATTTLTQAQLPAHSHGSDTLATGSAGGHSHGSGTLAAGSAGGHSHGSGTLATGTAGSHIHSIRGSVIDAYDQNRVRAASGSDGRYTTSASVNPAGDHTHPISGSTATAGAHTHPISGSTGSGAAHTHPVTGSTATTGGGAAIDNRPPFYALAYICRLPDGPELAEGMVVLWSGTAQEIPAGWTICDGTEGTPDLRDRFVVGAGAGYEVGQTGGTATTTLTQAQLPSHSHGSGTLATGSAGGHSHGEGTLAAGSAGGHSHGSGTLATGSAGAHTHSVRGSVANGSDQDYLRSANDSTGRYTSSDAVNPAGEHTHPITGSTASAGAHTHPISGSTGIAGAHTHAITGSTDATGAGAAIDNRPPYRGTFLMCRPPGSVVTITAPAFGETVFGPTAVTADVTGSSVAAVELWVDGIQVASASQAPYELVWDTTTTADGDRLVEIRAVDADGQPISDHVGVIVANETSVQQRLDVDFEAGGLSVDDYVRYAVWSVTGNPQNLPARYSSVEGIDRASGWMLGVLSNWESLDPETKDELAEYLWGSEDSDPEASLQDVGDPCSHLEVRFARLFLCKHEVPDFTIHYNIGGSEAIEHITAHKVADTLQAAKDYFVSELGYRDRSHVDIWIFDGQSQALPGSPLARGNIVLNNNRVVNQTAYLPAHELFHQIQYEYIKLFRFLPRWQQTTWWMEATAEWAAQMYLHRAGPDDADDEKYLYATSIDDFLVDPHNGLSRIGHPKGGAPQYGAFLLADYLHARFGRDVVRQTWEEIDTGVFGTDALVAINRMIETLGDTTLAEEIPVFWEWTYSLRYPGLPNGPDDDVDLANHVEVWRAMLQERPGTKGDNVISPLNRMARATDQRAKGGDPALLLTDGDVAHGEVRVEGGGAAVLEIKPDGPGDLDVTLSASADGINVEVLPLVDYDGAYCADRDVSVDGRTFTSTVAFVSPCKYVAVIITNTDALADGVRVGYRVGFGAAYNTSITNGTILLGLNPEGQLNIPWPEPTQYGDMMLGLRYVPTGAEALAVACPCEGWGVADALSGVYGWANQAAGSGSLRVTVLEADFQADRAFSRVRVGTSGWAPVFEVTHRYLPAPQTPDLYRIEVEIRNVTSVWAGNFDRVHARYRRVMDWDVEPTPLDEFVTIKPTSPLVSETVVFTSNDGHAYGDPLSGPSDRGITGFFTDYGPKDQGALIDFDFGLLDPGQSVAFTMYYGAAGSHADAIAAIDAVGADLYSLAKPNDYDDQNPPSGEPNTFIWAYTAPE